MEMFLHALLHFCTLTVLNIKIMSVETELEWGLLFVVCLNEGTQQLILTHSNTHIRLYMELDVDS